MQETKELAQVKDQLTALESKATEAKITTDEQYTEVVDYLGTIKNISKTLKAEKEKITNPANETLKAARAFFAPFEKRYTDAETILKSKLLDYKKRKDAEAAKKETQFADRVERGTMKMETAERKIGEIKRVENTTRGNVGEVQVRKIKKVRITDEAALPREYLKPDEVAIRRDALSGKQIPGVEVYEEETIATR